MYHKQNVAVYYIVFLHIMLIIFFCFYSFFYLTSVFPSATFAKIIHQVTSYQEPINAFSDDKLLDSKSDWKYPLRSQIMYFSSYDDSLELPKVILKRKSTFLQIEQRMKVKGFSFDFFVILVQAYIQTFYQCRKENTKISK